MTPITVSPRSLYEAGEAVRGVSGSLSGRLSSLVKTLSGCGGMCGNDPAGMLVAHSVDETSHTLVGAARDAVNAIARIGDAIMASASNYDQADHSSNVAPSGGVPLPFPQPTPEISVTMPPSSEGGAGEPLLAKAVESLVSMACPNGHQDKLRSAATAWRSLGSTCQTAVAAMKDPVGIVDAQRIPEAPHIDVALAAATRALSDTATASLGLADKLDQYAHHLDDVHQALLRLVSKLGNPAALVKGVIDLFTSDDHSGVARDIETVLDNFGDETAALGEMIEPYLRMAEQVAESMADYIGMALYEVSAPVVNAAASLGNAIDHDPLGMGLAMAGAISGVLGMAAGAGGDVAAAAMSLTGIGAVPGVAVAAGSTGLLMGATALTGASVTYMADQADSHRVSPMSNDRGGGAPQRPSSRSRPPREGDKEYEVYDPKRPGDQITDIDHVENGVLWEEKSATGGDPRMNITKWVSKNVDGKLDSYLNARQHLDGYQNAPLGIKFTEPGATPEFKAAVESAAARWQAAHPGVDVRIQWTP